MNILTPGELRQALARQAPLLVIAGPLAEQLQAVAVVGQLHPVEVRALRNLTVNLRRSRDRSAPALLAQQSGLEPAAISTLLTLGLALCLKTWQHYRLARYQAVPPQLVLQHHSTLPQLDEQEEGGASAAG